MSSRFKCDLCLKSFSNSKNLKNHKLIHEGIQAFQCPQCPKAFVCKKYLKQHSKTHVDFKEVYHCDICGKGLSSKSYLAEHKKWHSKVKHRKCPLCDRTFFHLTSLKVHMKCHTGDKPYKCRYEGCGAEFLTSSGRNRHEAYKHMTEKPYECDTCHRKFKTKCCLKMHIENVHTERERVQCTECSKTFSSKRAMQSHKRQVHRQERKLYSCPVCSKVFKSSVGLKSHDVVHTKVRTEFCQVCGKGFSLRGNMLRHMKLHSGKKNYKCSKCDQAWATSCGLRHHVLQHHLEKEFACDICGMKLATKSSLTSHISGHSNERPYVCGICSSAYKVKSSLKEHMLVHNGTSIACDTCSMKFSSKYLFKRHIDTQACNKRNHSFGYSVCKRQFTTKRSLKKHNLVHRQTAIKEKVKDHCETFMSVSVKQPHEQIFTLGEDTCDVEDCNPICCSEDELFYCDLCGDHVQEKCEIENHMENHLNTGREISSCSNAGELCVAQGDEVSHQKNVDTGSRDKQTVSKSVRCGDLEPLPGNQPQASCVHSNEKILLYSVKHGDPGSGSKAEEIVPDSLRRGDPESGSKAEEIVPDSVRCGDPGSDSKAEEIVPESVTCGDQGMLLGNLQQASYLDREPGTGSVSAKEAPDKEKELQSNLSETSDIKELKMSGKVILKRKMKIKSVLK